MRRSYLCLAVLAAVIGALVPLSAASASASRAVMPGAVAPGAATAAVPAASAGTYAKAYSLFVNGAQVSVYPTDIQATSDGGSIALAGTSTATAQGADWLVKLSATGTPLWQEEVGCAGPNGAPGDYASGNSVQQTADGGYVVAGQTIDCGQGSTCPALSSLSCALVEKFDAAGKLTWARAYRAAHLGSGLNQIRQTADGGYIAVGSITGSGNRSGALVLRLDGSGHVQWQRDLGPAGPVQAYLNAAQQTSDGGYVTAGDYYTPAVGVSTTQVLVAKFGADGSLQWEQGFATPAAKGQPDSTSDATAILQTPDGGYAVGGGWSNKTFNGNNGAIGALLLKLGPGGDLQWQRAYSGGVYCYYNGFSETCTTIGGFAYSLHQTAAGGYVMAGDSDIEFLSGVQIVPWQAGVDASGNLHWQRFYYQTYTTGAPLTENFQASAPTAGGYISTGPTENYPAQREEMYVVKTSGSGLAGSCGDVHPATKLKAISPQLIPVAPALPAQATATTPTVTSPIATTATEFTTHTDC